MAQQDIPGFKILMIRQVLSGQILNAENADTYPLVECGTWISDTGNWMIQQTYFNDGYALWPHTNPPKHDGEQFWGSLETILKEYKNLPEEDK